MRIKIKKLHPEAVVPKYASFGDAGLDLTAISVDNNPDNNYIEYGTGLCMEIPLHHVGFLFPRSSISKKSLMLANSVGVVDSGYRGEIKIRMRRLGDNVYSKGERIAQLIVMYYPHVDFAIVDDLDQSPRGDGGFGSTGAV